MEGNGTIKLNSFEVTYKGLFANDKIDGEGLVTFKRGSLRGEFKDLKCLEGNIQIFFNQY